MNRKIYLINSFHWQLLLMITCTSIFFTGCKKLIEVDAPGTSINAGNVYTSDETAIAVLTALYAGMSQGNLLGLTWSPGLSSDELTLFSGTGNTSYIAYYQNNLASNTSGGEYWNKLYGYQGIYTCNAAITGLDASASLTPGVKQQLLGEAYFMRAFFYFYLVNLYGDVPLALTTDYTVNAVLHRSSQADVYQQIITDLKEAQNLLSADYLKADLINGYPTGAEERVRPTKWAATALLARAYLYSEEYADAELQATAVIDNSTLFETLSLNEAFKKNSREGIWNLQPVNSGWNTEDARLFTIISPGPTASKPIYLSDQLLASFETGDQRKTNWVAMFTDATSTPAVDYYCPYKYKSATTGDPVTEYSVVLRLAEQYLIRAEARAQAGNTTGALEDLDVIRHRAGLGDYIGSTDKAALLSAILHERQVELFTEWGHRWFDLKRTKTIDAVMAIVTPLKANGKAWQSYMQWFPIGSSEILNNPNLTQTEGY